MLTNPAFQIARAVLCLLIWTMVCAGANAQVDFNRQVRPILAEHCLQCHGPDAEKRNADLRLDVEAEAKKSAIIAGTAARSELIHRIQSTDPESVMPPPATGKMLTNAEKEILWQWIQEGAKYSDHWAFQPIPASEPLLNSLPAPDAGTLSVDRFVMDKLQAAGLRYSNPVGRAQFIRRATFDLTGLPPTWAEVEAFETDTAEGSEERLIDRLLESSRYGERWGRHWLDIARYADTHGGAAIGFTTFPFSFTYRDYVINAFNHDLPFDRFLLEQIAADQLELPENDPSLAALGFLTVGMQFRNSNDTIDDQIDVITRGLMGLTVTCARCHDHKFDPIPTADYYSLYASIAPSKAPKQLPAIGAVADEEAQQQYKREFSDLKIKYQQFAREQNDILRNRLRMQVGLYLAEIAKGVGEQDLSTQFLSYRTDDIRPLVFNRWRTWLAGLSKDDAVFGPWLEMQSWGTIPEAEFQKRRDEYLNRLSGELDAIGRTPDKLHALRGEPPKWNPFIVDALVEQKPSSLSEAAGVYGRVFAEQQRSWLQSLLDSSSEAAPSGIVLPDDHPQHQIINSPSHRQIRHHLYAAGSPFDVSDEDAVRLTNRTVNDLASGKKGAMHQLNLASPGSPPRAMIVQEDSNPDATHIFVRGNPLARGDVVQARFLSALPGDHTQIYEDGKRRLGLARSVISDRNPLTARVLVNWAWQNHFGVGIVRTPDDFGTRGEAPTHPELLDYLADQFRKHGWSMKWLHRQIMLSQAYRQGAIENENCRQVDPENQLLWRMPRRRLDFEAMRDSMLAVSDELDLKMGGRPIDLNASPAVPRRSVYGFVNRDIIANLMSTFDTANPNACTAMRPETTVPQQALFALNSDFIQDRALRLASITKEMNAASDADRIVAMIRRTLCRNPSESEVGQAKNFLNDAVSSTTTTEGATADPERGWTLLAHALMAS
ncbi:MAG: PSD1 and planctomycete cytochrome C domain-containing protein, partial [Planctomycetota bacterium]|nr:PSD1 and planctomycete cytochrome C domain-containing protein [Planctomycetota bacterium]